MIGNRERVGRTLELLHKSLYPFVEREIRAIYSDKWEVQANIPNGVPGKVVRTVTENCRVLKFTTQEFEDE